MSEISIRRGERPGRCSRAWSHRHAVLRRQVGAIERTTQGEVRAGLNVQEISAVIHHRAENQIGVRRIRSGAGNAVRSGCAIANIFCHRIYGVAREYPRVLVSQYPSIPRVTAETSRDCVRPAFNIRRIANS